MSGSAAVEDPGTTLHAWRAGDTTATRNTAGDRTTETGGTLQPAVVQTAIRLVPGHGQPLDRHLTLLAEVEPGPPPEYWTESRAARLSSLLVARARRDALGDGIDLVERYFDDGRLNRPSSLSSGARSGLYASVSEYCTAAGWPQKAAHFAAESVLFAETDAELYRALSVHALALSLNGEYGSAAEAVARAHATFLANGWGIADVSHCLVLGEGLLAATRADSTRLTELAALLAEAGPDDPYWAYSAQMIRVTANFFDRDLGTGLAESRRLLYSSHRARSFRLIRELLLGLHADMLALSGELDEALKALESAVTHPGHAVCFPMQRAAALMLLGRDRDVIESTNACVALHDEHCLRTLTPLLTRRAVAFLRTGNEPRAIQSMESAILLILRTGGSLEPFLMVPLSDAEKLLDLVSARREDLAPAIALLRAALPSLAAPTAAPIAVALTPAERELAELLSSDKSVAEIARGRGVSVNTVKSQLRSVYAKLGASRREEAVAALRDHQRGSEGTPPVAHPH